MASHGNFLEHLADDALLPSQYVDMHTGHQADPNKRLWLACLEEAIKDWQRAYAPVSGRRPYTESRQISRRLKLDVWLTAGVVVPGSYLWLCQVFAIDPIDFAAILERWKTQPFTKLSRRGRGPDRMQRKQLRQRISKA